MTDSYAINSVHGNQFHIKTLSKEFCKTHSNEILEIINIIPYIHWTEQELFYEDDYFKNKWQYSLVVTDSDNKIAGVLIAYFRLADHKHIMDSLYIHKLAVKSEYQKNGIGTNLLKYFILQSYSEIAWLWNISVQTNDEITNQYVIDFYSKIGFSKYYNVNYQNKIDILMVYERDFLANSFFTKEYNVSFSQKELKHPRVNVDGYLFYKWTKMPIVSFASTNETKKAFMKFIFNNYNFEVLFTNPVSTLTEPQIESSDLIEEQNLVRFPLKLVSRFINKTPYPYVIEDSMIFIEFFNQNGSNWELPGHDTKRWGRQLGANGILNILGNTQKRKAKLVSQIGAYVKSNEYYFGRGETMGNISFEVVTPNENLLKLMYPSFFHSIFIPDGANKVLAEMDMCEFSKYDYIRKSILDFIKGIRYNDTFNNQIIAF